MRGHATDLVSIENVFLPLTERENADFGELTKFLGTDRKNAARVSISVYQQILCRLVLTIHVKFSSQK